MLTAFSCPNKQAIIGRLFSPVPIKNLQKSSKSTYITLIYLAFAQRNRIGLWLSDSRIPTDSGFGTSRFSSYLHALPGNRIGLWFWNERFRRSLWFRKSRSRNRTGLWFSIRRFTFVSGFRLVRDFVPIERTLVLTQRNRIGLWFRNTDSGFAFRSVDPTSEFGFSNSHDPRPPPLAREPPSPWRPRTSSSMDNPNH